MIETWKTELTIGYKIGVIYMDLSKVFNGLNHELLTAKLKFYGLDQHAVNLYRIYLSNLYQSCKINNTRRKIIASVPQRSMLGPLLSKYFQIFFFLKDDNLGNYGEYSTLCLQ